jgi:hypothetical protein
MTDICNASFGWTPISGVEVGHVTKRRMQLWFSRSLPFDVTPSHYLVMVAIPSDF